MSCSLFCGWKVDDEDDMEEEEVDDSGEDWVESSPLDLKQPKVSDLTNQTALSLSTSTLTLELAAAMAPSGGCPST